MFTIYGINIINISIIQKGGIMGTQTQTDEKYIDIEELIKESLSDKNMTDEKEDLVLEYLCQTISKTDSHGILKKKAQNGDSYAYIQLASWHIAHAKNIKDYCEAFQYASKAAKRGYVEAYYILGQLYLYGVGCNKNIHKAVRYLSNFVNQITSKELLNDDVLIDAYKKLAEAEKSLGHFDKAYSYYQKLQEYDSHYDAYAKEMHQEMQKHRNSYVFNLIFVVCCFLVLCIVIYFLTQYIFAETKAYANRYSQKENITIIEPQEVSLEEKITEDMIIVQEPVSYRFVSEEEFLALSLSELEITETQSTSEYKSQKGNNYSVSNLIDHDSGTTWQEGEEDAGIGQQLTFVFKEPAILSAIRLENGKRTDADAFYANNRAASLRIFEEDSILIELPDSQQVQYIVFENPIMESQVVITLESVFSGTKWNDTCISEITFYE